MAKQATGSKNHRKGSIEVICGSMFSGKTEELIRRVRRAEYAKQRVQIFKPELDVRYAKDGVVSHDARQLKAAAVKSPSEILNKVSDPDLVAIDEVQFFDSSVIDVCQELANKGVRVVVAGLDKDYSGKPFGPMPQLMALAEYVDKIHAVCLRCGELANFSYRKEDTKQLIVLGEKENYEPLCRSCYIDASEE